jgi:hypothetical protein
VQDGLSVAWPHLYLFLSPGGHGDTFFVGVFRGVFLFSLFFVSAPTWVIAGDPIVCDLALEIPASVSPISVWGVGLAYLHLGYLRGIGWHFSLAGAPVGDRWSGVEIMQGKRREVCELHQQMEERAPTPHARGAKGCGLCGRP